MTVIRINAIEVAEGKGPELARRFAARARAVDAAEGFEGFELLEPTDGRSTWLVVTRWRDAGCFERWVASPAFGHGHRGPEAGSAARAGAEGAEGAAAGAGAGAGGEPVTLSSELWSYVPVELA